MKLRPTTLVLLAVNSTALAATAWMLMAPNSPQWLPRQKPTAITTPRPPAPLPELAQSARATTWNQPIFSVDRQPDPQRQGQRTSVLANLALSGVVLDGQSRWAYLHEGHKPARKVALGTTLDNGWTLTELTALTATFTRAGQTHTLSMPLLRLPPPSKAPAITLPRIETP
ncbi:general secretion pathway protein GspN [Pseudomonas sp. BN505]|uniref:general secretion pathway protein GspN n=1 Tax=unclassified Pseudomonas TaxID=196821 RepID=UPI002454080A|nr:MULTISPECIES: general secretion pathway protein GspN [unclassified Pseudomonas]MDH4846014.1 general secretion pathway protein GspN [Pseudomonas sp. BN605]MDH4858123.1 general secretion pathway protein GspN [Pseudomonas sp. BN505]